MSPDGSSPLALGFETGGRKIAAVVCDATGALVSRAETTRSSSNQAPDTLERLLQAGKDALAKAGLETGKLVGAGWGFGGMVDRQENQPYCNPHEPGWEGFPARERVEETFQVPLKVENDCNAAALAEYFLGAGERRGSMVYITVGSGIGGGIVRGGQLFEGGRFGEAEIGHLVVEPDGLPCPCGNRGCLEASCSGDGLGRLALANRERLLNSSPLAQRLEHRAPETIAPLLFEAYPEDPLAAFCLTTFIDRMGLACSTLVNLFNPDIIVMGGGVLKHAWLLPEIHRAMEGRVAPQLQAPFRLKRTSLGENVVPVGAALLGFHAGGEPFR